MDKKIEPLDYCRVKKIFDKGFGFLSSLYYPGNVFFHFSRIRDAEVKEKLEKLKRGEIYIFFTSKEEEVGKRKVARLWLDLKNVDKRLIDNFVDKIINEMNFGNRNPFELTTVIRLLRENNYIKKEKFKLILSSNKILRTPSALKFIFTEEEKLKLEQVLSEGNELVVDENTKSKIIKELYQ